MGHLFTYVKTCEIGPVKISVITRFFSPGDPDDRVIMELQCSTIDHLLASGFCQSPEGPFFSVIPKGQLRTQGHSVYSVYAPWARCINSR